MPPAARVPPGIPDLRQHLGIETPEHVQLHLELAGLGSRTAAALLDVLLIQAVLAVLLVLSGLLGIWGSTHPTAARSESGWLLVLLYFAVNFALLAYFGLFEALAAGRTPGKRLLGIRVVMETGRPVTAGAVGVRTLLRLVDTFFPLAPFLPGMVAIAFHPHHKRLGDMAAGTVVVRDRPTDWALAPASEPDQEPLEAGPPELSDDEFRLLDRFLDRRETLDPAAGQRMANELVRRFEARIPRRTADAEEYLVRVLTREQGRRRSPFATRARGGSAGRTAVAAERFVARKRNGWDAFYDVARRVERAGLKALAPALIPGFAASYREVAADLARARTYGVDPTVIEYLERLVSAGHNVLYGARGRPGLNLAHRVLREYPAAVVRSARYVLIAWALFAGSAIAGYVLLREQPALAQEIVSPVLVNRAEQAAERQARGLSYAQQDAADRPELAAVLISNNVMVCFYVFAGGLLAGTWTVLVLLMNGLGMGIALGLFANYGALPYLTTFVAGHGVLELTAIFISAGAGLRLARALVAPGDLTRRDALVIEGRLAAPMVAVVVLLLVLAGAIEGLLSASDAPVALKIAVGAASAVLLGLYFWNGWRFEREHGAGSRERSMQAGAGSG